MRWIPLGNLGAYPANQAGTPSGTPKRVSWHPRVPGTLVHSHRADASSRMGLETPVGRRKLGPGSVVPLPGAADVFPFQGEPVTNTAWASRPIPTGAGSCTGTGPPPQPGSIRNAQPAPGNSCCAHPATRSWVQQLRCRSPPTPALPAMPKRWGGRASRWLPSACQAPHAHS